MYTWIMVLESMEVATKNISSVAIKMGDFQ
jgi:hypothetical protein